MSETPLHTQLMLTELLLALDEEGAAGQQELVEHGALEGDERAKALTALALIESSAANRRAERKRLLTAMSVCRQKAAD
jgi:hypothetical protein